MIITRRTLIGTAATAAVAVPLLSVLPVNAVASDQFDMSSVKTAPQFAAQVIGRAELSRLTCEIAVKKAHRDDAKEFAGLELMEANTVLKILKELGTPLPLMAPEAQATLAHIREAKAGYDFDKAYISAQHDNHVFLRDLAAAYLKNADTNSPNADERHGEQIASLGHFAFTEHVVLTNHILKALTA
jgi:putative membrane protein